MKYLVLTNGVSAGALFSIFRHVLAFGIFLFSIPGLSHAQQCTVAGGTLATITPTSNLCLNEDGSHSIELTVSGNVGIGRFGLVQAGTGNVVAVNTTGIFDMINYPPGNYQAGHVSVEDLSTFAGVTKVNQLMGCFDISNVIPVSTYWVDGGAITALGPTEISGGNVQFAVSGASGPNQRWALLNQQFSDILAVQPESTFDFDPYPDGTYRVAHAAFGPGLNLNNIDPHNLQGCIDASNIVTVLKSAGPVLGPDEVYNPVTGRIWKDRNLGANQVASAINDSMAYGDLYQWGRGPDGHQSRSSLITPILSSFDQPGNANFIIAPFTPFDWRSPKNNGLWQGPNEVNNPCPVDFRVPTEAEWNAERLSWSSSTSVGAFNSPLKLTTGGYRSQNNGGLVNVGSFGYYWSSTVGGLGARRLHLVGNAIVDNSYRANGHSVRCIKD